MPRGLKSWAVLARVILAERPVGRRELAGELFGEADDPLAALRWSLADLRRSFGMPALLRGDPLSLAPGELWVDARALEDGILPVEDIGGELLEGIELRNCPQFETWLLLARLDCAARGREELRRRALRLLAAGEAEAAMAAAGRAARLDPLDDGAQELFLRVLVAAGHRARAAAHLASCEGLFAREGLIPSVALRSAARDPGPMRPPRLRAGVVAASLLRAGAAALDAGAADAGIETLRRAAEEAGRAADLVVQAEVQLALGSALVHAVRGFDGEGAVVLHRALLAARVAGLRALVAEILRELAYVDVQAGRHASADSALREAWQHADGDHARLAGILAIQGMNQTDRGRHLEAAESLTESCAMARKAGQARQEAFSQGLLARSLLLAGDVLAARRAAERSMAVVHRERWNAFLPWPQVLHAQCLGEVGRWEEARQDAEQAFALACELGDPCWEGMTARALGMLALHSGDPGTARDWLADARRRCDRVPDRYVWVSAYIALAELELAAQENYSVAPAAARLYEQATQYDLPEFLAWALVYQAESGDDAKVLLARGVSADIANPDLHARVQALPDASPPRVAARSRRLLDHSQ
jgi:tetratricopeptide (TPR) repeat protein/DNA-binding SARP family transcriptional activator